MGLYDREYYRDDEPTGFRLGGGGRSMVITLIVINALVYLACIVTKRAPNDYWLIDLLELKASALSLWHPLEWYRFVTNGFTHVPDITHVLFNMFGLWVFGRDVENIYGPWEILRIYLVVVVLGSLIWALSVVSVVGVENAGGNGLLGASGAVYAITMLFIRHFPQRTILLMFVLPVRAWVVGVLYVVVSVLGLGSGGNVAHNVHLVGIVFGLGYYQFHWRLGWLTPTGWLDRLRGWWKRTRPGAPKLRVHAPDVEDRYRKLDEEADRLLDKVHREGEASLTDKERRALQEYSRRMRQKHS